ncbi:putative DNA replication licensing factor [Clavispora lusitaniae]|uniref:DNA replication licensing factor MCM4 n=2 Tax=Clavispora lusitaniae TaxID=36911 RepID=C4Y3B6_CLAL4|nr:uncharacterized protein CLUG_03029 [Clavispora lusitaniae ATCC 42720]QFZ27288.1 putative DNA replication licensing factor [Clavispora lusitaniae]EEQ38903.1 conserved hypothetical protein [Clavispora lusitaniae ATCC 42720]QFZ33404.1 putative DNA replication licensing factor [Clavispora lusitaniae]QFZ39075.1 putative DNA replication licensing factor [Clavispora lusitaniae]QFZ44757.1 putative DNA replication licensing factor [Clavispora lusitaniae]
MSSSPVRSSRDSASQSQSQPVPSSPLFFASSSDPPSESSKREISSPLHYTSSSRAAGSSRGHLGSSQPDLPSEDRITRRPARSDLNSDVLATPVKRRMFATSSDPVEGDADAEPVRVIWGTNVSIQDCSNAFRDFLMSFKMKHRRIMDGQPVEPEDSQLYYVGQLTAMKDLGTTNLNLDAANLLAYPPTKKLYYQLINYPQEVIPIMDQTVKDCLVSLFSESAAVVAVDAIETNIYTIRPYNINAVKKGMRELNPNDIDKLVSVKGLVLRASAIVPDMKVAFFKCSACDHTLAVEIDRGVISEPTKCPRAVCGQVNSMALVHNRSSFADKQVVKLQETPDMVPAGQTPHSVNLCVYDELVDTCRAGDRVEVCGIFRSLPVRVNARQRAVKSLYKTYLDVVHVQKIDARRLGVDSSTAPPQDAHEVEQRRVLSPEDIERVREISQRDDLYEVLARSLAPSVYEMDDVKKGILLQLFGGTNKQFRNGGRYRGDINVLLCGDPSTSKSQILQYVHKIAPRGIYTSGKGSSAVGLTAYITRDIDTKQLVLESGALVLSDGGVCCIDEFDKMSDATRSVLHEVMEQQTISIAKAGIITTLNARTAILASANPINSRYDPRLPVTANIDLPPPLLSRFDLVYLILDKVDESIDRHLARHITDMYLEDEPESVSAHAVLPVETLSIYIQYAKENVHPQITAESKAELVRAYVDMRRLGDDARAADKRITATTRQLESMIRLSEAHAKMRLSPRVELVDVKEAVRLIKSAIKDYATDPITGRIDMDMVQTGTTMAQRRMQEDLAHEVLALLDSPIRFSDLVTRINEKSSVRVENADLNECLRRLQQEGKIVESGDTNRRTIRKLAVI